VLTKAGERAQLLVISARVDRAHAQAGPQQSAGLSSMDGLQQRRVRRLAFAFDIANLAANHASHGAGGGGQFRDERHLAMVRAVHLRQHLKREREQRVARQNRHGVAENFVAGWNAAPQIVVIERRQIVMNQRIGVDQFERAGAGFNAYSQVRNRFGGRHAQNGANAFAACKQAVAHRSVDGFGQGGFGRDPTLQCGIHTRLLSRQIFGQRHCLSGRKGSA
jgi:hypothetical protein